MTNIKILVSGASGRIGKHLVDALLKDGEDVRVLIKDKMTEFENVETFYGDLLDIESLKKAVSGVDVIYHLAAVVDYLAPKDLMWKVNVLGMKNLLDVSKGKFIYLSSTAVLGKKIKNLPADERTPYHPSDFYGKTKMEAEKLAKEHGVIIIRSADVYGAGFEEGYHYVFDQLEKGKMPVFGNGKNIIQYIHIDDLIQALLLARKNGKNGEIYTVAGKDIMSQRELYELICKHLDVPFREKHVSAGLAKSILYIKNIGTKKPQFIPEFINKLSANRIFDITKARNELSYEPKMDYDTGISEMIKNYKKSKEEQKEITEEQSEEQS